MAKVIFQLHFFLSLGFKLIIKDGCDFSEISNYSNGDYISILITTSEFLEFNKDLMAQLSYSSFAKYILKHLVV